MANTIGGIHGKHHRRHSWQTPLEAFMANTIGGIHGKHHWRHSWQTPLMAFMANTIGGIHGKHHLRHSWQTPFEAFMANTIGGIHGMVVQAFTLLTMIPDFSSLTHDTFNSYKPGTLFVGHRQTVLPQTGLLGWFCIPFNSYGHDKMMPPFYRSSTQNQDLMISKK